MHLWGNLSDNNFNVYCLLIYFVTEPPEIVPFTFGSEAVDEASVAQLTCLVSKGDEPLNIHWSMKGDVVSSEPSISTTMLGTRMSVLMISSVGYRHSGTYTCTASNKAGSRSVSAELRVNGI